MTSKPKQVPERHRLWFDAIQAGDLVTVKSMQSGSNKIPIDIARPDGRTGLIMAAGNNDHEMVAFLLGAGASVRSRSRTGHTALRAAVAPDWGGQYTSQPEGSWEKTILKLLQYGAALDQAMIYGILQSWDGDQIIWLLKHYRKTIPADVASKAVTAAKTDFHERQVDESTFRENCRMLLAHASSRIS